MHIEDAKILIADDDTNICDLLKIYLENEGYETVTAYDGIKALSALRFTNRILCFWTL